jgi:hypothetical protein
MKDKKKEIKVIFSTVKDPRVFGRCLHELSDILFIAFCTFLANGEDYEDMVEFTKQPRWAIITNRTVCEAIAIYK